MIYCCSSTTKTTAILVLIIIFLIKSVNPPTCLMFSHFIYFQIPRLEGNSNLAMHARRHSNAALLAQYALAENVHANLDSKPRITSTNVENVSSQNINIYFQVTISIPYINFACSLLINAIMLTSCTFPV